MSLPARINLSRPKSIVSVVALLLSFSFFPASAWAVKVGQVAPEVMLKSMTSGEQISLSAYKGKVVFLDVWASWCPPCRKSLPLFNDMYKELGQYGLEIIAVNVDEDPADGLAFLEKHPVDYKVVADPQGTVPQTYSLKGMPTSYLIDQQGVIRMVHDGFKEKDLAIIKGKIIKLLGR